jgi:hypothetical protein
VCKGFLFSLPSPTFVTICVLDNSHSHWKNWYLIAVLICILLMISAFRHIFTNLLAICKTFEKCLCGHITYAFWISLFVFWYQVAYVFWYSPLLRYIACKYFLPLCRLPHQSIYSFLYCTEAFLFATVSFVCFCFCFLCFHGFFIYHSTFQSPEFSSGKSYIAVWVLIAPHFQKPSSTYLTKSLTK